MKRSMRVKLLQILLSLTLLTVLAVGVSGYLNMRSSAHELTDELLEQIGAHVDQHVENFVDTAHRQTSVMQHLFKSGLLDLNQFKLFANFAYEIVDSLPILSAVYYIRQDGTAVFVMRSPETKRIT